MSMFRKAQRAKAKLKIGLCGTAGSGKTYSALQIAMGLSPGGRIAMIDTERGSGELYSHLCEYDVCPLGAPYSPDRYVAAIKGAEKEGYDVLIIDSLTHAWTGEGGVLEMHDRASSANRTANSYTAWRDVTPHHNALVEAILGANMHVIVTMRTKTAYELVDDGSGKKKPVKIGLAPVQRDGMEYEFSLVFDLSVDKHVATSSKDRTGLFDGKAFIPSPETGATIREWIEGGADLPTLAGVLKRIEAASTEGEIEDIKADAGKLTSKEEKRSAWEAMQRRAKAITQQPEQEIAA